MTARFFSSTRVLVRIAFVTLTISATIAFAAGDSSRDRVRSGEPVFVGVYTDVGAGRASDLVNALRQMPQVYVRRMTAEEIRRGELERVDVLIHPGGSGGKQGRQLAPDGREAVRDFVRDGGGFIGICAGAYLASADYEWSLDILDAKVLDRKHWARGNGVVEIAISDHGRKLLRETAEDQQIFYGQGPLLAPANDPTIPDYQSLATYQSEIAKNGAPQGVMIGTTAIASGQFGDGRVLCFSPHPEKTMGLEEMVHRAVEWVGKAKTSHALDLPGSVMSAVKRTPDISQKEFSNGNHCAPCAVANVLIGMDLSNERALSDAAREIKSDDQIATVETDRELVKCLADDAHMQTAKLNGTNRYRLVNGLLNYLSEPARSQIRVGYVGVRRYDRNQLDVQNRAKVVAWEGVPTFGQLKERLAQGQGTVILFGSYKPDSETGRWERVGRHYVAAVGYGIGKDGLADPRVLVLHDSNDGFSGNKFVIARQVESSVSLWSDGVCLASSDRWVRLEGAPITKDGRVAFLETVLTFAPKPN